MSGDERPSEVLGGLPRTRPHRRSQKRAPAPDPAPSASRVGQPAQPPGTPSAPSPRRPVPAGGVDLIVSAVRVSAELAEIGFSAGARALRGVVAWLPGR